MLRRMQRRYMLARRGSADVSKLPVLPAAGGSPLRTLGDGGVRRKGAARNRDGGDKSVNRHAAVTEPSLSSYRCWRTCALLLLTLIAGAAGEPYAQA